MTGPDPDPDLPIRASEATDTRCKHAMLLAHQMGVKARQPVDMQDPETVDALIHELWPDTDWNDPTQVAAHQAQLPQDGGLYYLVYIDTPADPEPVLLPAGDSTLGALFAMGVAADPDNSWRLVYRQGILPRRQIPPTTTTAPRT